METRNQRGVNPAEVRRWLVVVLFAAAMAWVEAAVVFDLRTLVNRIEPWQPHPLPDLGPLGSAELVRELATLVMLGTVGWLAGRSASARFGYACVAFGIWDILYYVFLRVLTGWPHSLVDWDILFLLPLPWWGPVIAPCLIAVLLVIGGSLLVGSADREGGRSSWPSRPAILAAGAGAALALGVFMADSIPLATSGVEVLREVLPQKFWWVEFGVALGLMAIPVVELAQRRWSWESRVGSGERSPSIG
jgi:hypothetical protein